MEKADKKTVRSSIRSSRFGSISDDKRNNSPLKLIVKRFNSGPGQLFLHIEDNKEEMRLRGGGGCKFWRSMASASVGKHIKNLLARV
jgi:hypothetical protein